MENRNEYMGYMNSDRRGKQKIIKLKGRSYSKLNEIKNFVCNVPIIKMQSIYKNEQNIIQNFSNTPR